MIDIHNMPWKSVRFVALMNKTWLQPPSALLTSHGGVSQLLMCPPSQGTKGNCLSSGVTGKHTWNDTLYAILYSATFNHFLLVVVSKYYLFQELCQLLGIKMKNQTTTVPALVKLTVYSWHCQVVSFAVENLSFIINFRPAVSSCVKLFLNVELLLFL